jgi:hypothetical protein
LHDRYFESRGDPTLVYRLAVRKEQPDFRLVAVPYIPPQAADQGPPRPWAAKRDSRIVQVLALRRDGQRAS